MSQKPLELIGKTFNGVMVMTRDREAPTNSRKVASYLCRCYCGVVFSAIGVNIYHGRTRSCGCLRIASFVTNLHLGRDRHNARKKLIRAKQIQIADLLGMAELVQLYAAAAQAQGERMRAAWQ